MTGKESSKKEPFSIYFHLPFCTKKCSYCHFYVIPNKESFQDLLMKGLSLDIDLWALQMANKQLVSIYFGGGTPSLVSPEKIAFLIDSIRKITPFVNHEIEITLEANPETVSLELMKAYAGAGINRISIGVQSLDDALLKKLGREHHALKAVEAIHITSKAGIKNISIDLMYDIPGQTLVAWQKTLQAIETLPITHLSLYNLTIEPHTIFFKHRDLLQKELPDEETSSAMYQLACQQFDQIGFDQYEISAFAKNGQISIHNSGYWHGRPFLGFGPSAFSYWENKRFRSIANLNRYVDSLQTGKSPIDFTETLDEEAKKRELLVIALRLRAGVNIHDFEQKHGKLSTETNSCLEKLVEEGFLEIKSKEPSTTVCLSSKGTLFYDSVAVEII